MELTITLHPGTERSVFFGPNDRNIKILRDAYDIKIVARDGAIKLSGPGETVGTVASVIDRMQQILLERGHLEPADVHESISLISMEKAQKPTPEEKDRIDVFSRSARIVPKTAGQRRYIEAIEKNDLVFCLGPAGTGKTYLAVAAAVMHLKHGRIKRIILVRPAVEAGEKLGFLPGDLQAKVNPYLRPLFDAMHDMMSFDQLKRFMMNDIIEVVPLAYMRGRTLNNAIIILDEAQNTTTAQMLMFLTRLGHNSKMIITGDDTQIDLANPKDSGLIDAVNKLKGIEGIAIVKLSKADIVRHKLVQKIVQAYGRE